MFFNVFSWNMQGWGNKYSGVAADAKIRAVFRSIQNYPPNSRIIMLQECGNPGTTGLVAGRRWTGPDGANYICHINEVDPTADNLRCSTAILVSENLHVEKCGILTVDGATFGGVTRPCVYVVINGMYFATMHAIANGTDSVSDVKKAVEKLAGKRVSWLLMGDFNSEPTDYAASPEPEKLNDVLISGTHDRPICTCKMICSGGPTQGQDGNRTAFLDFAFLNNDIGEANILYDVGAGARRKVFNEQQFAAWGKYLSDHNLIGLQLSK